MRLSLLLAPALLLLAACTEPTTETQLASDGRPLPKLYRIRAGDEARIQYEILDGVNALRQAAGAVPVTLDPRLNAAAATHSRDMANQNRPWHFGSDGSSPMDRVRRVGYTGEMLGENISETYESELETLSAWMEQPDTRDVILDRRGQHLGFAWHQENSGKIWWTLIMGGNGSAAAPDS
ncbi:CAP domain-containing protein [Pseudooceanicola sp.]|uniref:CAP domain-containing protein n=1 Tax=Pseudooceanicola sp. TaxID=1914328 RepID=UPI002628815B|nr:CAP domain-containing protein [Pseudooceanicola sp.]MDF1854979.1 CAP domain-containing protein [Pseudooceanicola sp.]